MKRLLQLATLVAFFSVKTAFANEGKDKVVPAVLQSFQSTFIAAKEVDWSISGPYYKVQFFLNDQPTVAYYQPDGSLVSITRNITSLQLPLTLQLILKKEYMGYWVADLYEEATDKGSFYYVTLENADNKLILKASSNTTWSLFQKMVKD